MTKTLEERRAELAQFERATDRIQAIDGQIADHKREIERLEARRDAFAFHGNEPIPIPIPAVNVPGLGLIELAPWRSAHTGKELAADVEDQVQALRVVIADLEAEMTGLQAA
jgi:hypothetical protein